LLENFANWKNARVNINKPFHTKPICKHMRLFHFVFLNMFYKVLFSHYLSFLFIKVKEFSDNIFPLFFTTWICVFENLRFNAFKRMTFVATNIWAKNFESWFSRVKSKMKFSFMCSIVSKWAKLCFWKHLFQWNLM
jgi:hypothetical protein